MPVPRDRDGGGAGARGVGATLVEAYDLVMFDLDGVVYVGDDAVPGAPEHLARVRDRGVHVAFVTNNASRDPHAVAEKLTGLGVEADASDVVTSAQAAARLLLDRHGAGAPVVVLGADGLREALARGGLRPVGVDDDAVAVVTGYGPDVVWHEVMRVATRIRDGLPWVASNTDLSLPDPRRHRRRDTGRWCGCSPTSPGSTPEVAGKPAPPLLEETIRRVGGSRPLMVGDRLDTDIEGGRRAGRRLAAGAHRGHRTRRPGGRRAGAAADVRRRGPGRPARAAPGARAPRRRRLDRGWLDGPRRRRPAGRSRATAPATTGGGPWRRAAWEHLGRDRESLWTPATCSRPRAAPER